MLLSLLLFYISGALKFEGWGFLHGQGLYCASSLFTDLILKLVKGLFWGVGPGGTFKRVVLSQVNHSVPSLVDNGLAGHL